ncbi:MAG: glycosyltransferase family 4 protein [Candidatus Cloacimonadia bacterium]
MILFIHTGFSTFVKNDYEILKKYFPVRKFHYKASKKLSINLLSQIEIFIWLLKNIWKAQYIYIWFADYHSFLPILFAKLFHKKSFLVLGGYDVTYIPGIRYGSFSNPLRAFCTKYSMKNATICLPVSHYVENEAKKRVVGLNSKVIYNGIDIAPNDYKNEKENIILTVGKCSSLQRVKLKGVDLFVETAKALPDYKFIAIGISKRAEKYLGEIPENVQLIDKLPHEELSDFYKKAKVYCQFSLFESFGLAVLEAISFGAIPIISNKGALPEIFGDRGFILKERSIDKAVKLIEKAMNSPESLGKKARERIMKNFSLEKRENKILSIIKEINE